MSLDDNFCHPNEDDGDKNLTKDGESACAQMQIGTESATLSAKEEDTIAAHFLDESHPYYLMHMPEPVDTEMLEQLPDPDKYIDSEVVKYLLTYFTYIALQQPAAKRCAVVAPHFTGQVMRDIERERKGSPRAQSIRTQRSFCGTLLTGCRDNFDYLMIPLYYEVGHTLAIWTRSRGQLIYYNPIQPPSERYSPRDLFVSTLREVFDEMTIRGCEVKLREIVSAPYHTYLEQSYSSSTAVHVCLLGEAFLLRSGTSQHMHLRGTTESSERWRYLWFLKAIRRGDQPSYSPPGWIIWDHADRTQYSLIDGFPLQDVNGCGHRIDSQRSSAMRETPVAAVDNAQCTDKFAQSEHTLELENLPGYISNNPTCCILFFNDAAYRPDTQTTKGNMDIMTMMICERIPWTTVDLKRSADDIPFLTYKLYKNGKMVNADFAGSIRSIMHTISEQIFGGFNGMEEATEYKTTSLFSIFTSGHSFGFLHGDRYANAAVYASHALYVAIWDFADPEGLFHTMDVLRGVVQAEIKCAVYVDLGHTDRPWWAKTDNGLLFMCDSDRCNDLGEKPDEVTLIKLDELEYLAKCDIMSALLECSTHASLCSRQARWVYDKIKMGNISCLRDDGLTWNEFVEANPSCYFAYYNDITEPEISAEIRNRLVELHWSGKACAYYYHPYNTTFPKGYSYYSHSPRIWRYLNTELVDDDYLGFNARLAKVSKVSKTPKLAWSRMTKFFKGLSPFRKTTVFAETDATSSDMRHPVKSVGKYEYMDSGTSLGSGVYGEVFKGWRKDGSVEVAIKVFSSKKDDAQREIEALKNTSNRMADSAIRTSSSSATYNLREYHGLDLWKYHEADEQTAPMPKSILDRTVNGAFDGDFTEPGIVAVAAYSAVTETPSTPSQTEASAYSAPAKVPAPPTTSTNIVDQNPSVPDDQAATDAGTASVPQAATDAATPSTTDAPIIAASAANLATPATITDIESRIGPVAADVAAIKDMLARIAASLPGPSATGRLPDTEPETDA